MLVVCGIGLGAQNDTYTKNITGSGIVLNHQILTTDSSDLVWTGITSYTTNANLIMAGITNCATSSCTDTQNPSDEESTVGETVNITITGAMNINDQQVRVSQTSAGNVGCSNTTSPSYNYNY